MRIDVSRVPRRARGMTADEVMLSESQERMLVAARPGREDLVERPFARWELHGTRIGAVIAERVLEIRDGDEIVASRPPGALADDAPEYDVMQWAAHEPAATGAPAPPPEAGVEKIGLELLELLASPAVASRRTLYRTYDQMVGTDTVLGPGSDAAVMRIKGRPDGLAFTIDAQPRVAALDPFLRAACAGAEAVRNLGCVRGRP